MGIRKLTVAWLDAVTTDKILRESDNQSPNLAIVIRPSGVKTWIWRGRNAGKMVDVKYGRYPLHSLVDARAWADRLTRERGAEVDIVERNKASKRAKVEEAIDQTRTVRACFETYMEFDGGKGRDAANKRAKFENDVLPVIGDRLISTITFEDLSNIVADKMRKFPNGGGANRLHAAIARMWRWLAFHPIGRNASGLTTNVYAGAFKPAEEHMRSGFLTDNAIRWLYQALDVEPANWRHAYKLLLLTGARRSEITDMRKTQIIDIDGPHPHIMIGADEAKNEQNHLVPLSPEAVVELKGALVLSGKSRFVFPAGGKQDAKRSISGFTKTHNRIYWNMFTIACSETPDADWQTILPHWTLHDFRRTMRSFMSRAANNIPKHVAEAVISHSGGKSKLDATYDLHEYEDEKRDALTKWAQRVSALSATSH